jgi:serine/threonine-protein kinase RsbW
LLSQALFYTREKTGAGMVLTLSLSRELSELPRIVEARRAFFAESRLPPSLAYPVDLATEELFVNMIRHNTGTRAPITLQLEAVEGGLAVSLTDHDVDPFDPGDIAPVDPEAPLSQRKAGGLGLHLVHALVGVVHYEYRDRCSTLRFFARGPAHV